MVEHHADVPAADPEAVSGEVVDPFLVEFAADDDERVADLDDDDAAVAVDGSVDGVHDEEEAVRPHRR